MCEQWTDVEEVDEASPVTMLHQMGMAAMLSSTLGWQKLLRSK
jgi:hypothetical protein